ncbi:MAG TPA: aminotransferase class V-fold PLP-dependent enzyme [Gaiellaceae bacterium]|nr:aminotransferase class V-fold PLP-dependent enzyme [Gaiellaceae bacterium]
MLAPSEYEGTPTRGYLDTATYGLPPRSTLRALEEALEGWRTRRRWRDWEEDAEACRGVFAELVGARAEDVALVSTVSAGAGIVAASLPAGPGDNVVLYERDFMSVVLPWRGLQARGVELRLLPLERLAEGIDERTALVAVSSVQSADGAVADLAALKSTGARLFVDATQAVGAVPTDLDGVDYLVTHAYKWLLSPRGLSFLYVHPERRSEIEPWTAGWKSCPNPYEDYYGFPELTDDARRLDVSVPWFAAAGARRSLELLLSLGPQRIADHNLALASRFTQELGRPEPAAPIVRVEVADADAAVERLQASGVACSMRDGAVRLSFHLYNDEADVELAAAALRPAGIPSTAP